MDHGLPLKIRGPYRLPRTRGDGPYADLFAFDTDRAPPHTRGWTRGDHLRGDDRFGSPAHAGMDPTSRTAQGWRWWLPRTRGDGPPGLDVARILREAPPHTRGWTFWSWAIPVAGMGSPAHAGMDPAARRVTGDHHGLPRTRGDGPVADDVQIDTVGAPPHTRGWTPLAKAAEVDLPGSPAHAGMDPTLRAAKDLGRRLPRTRGDGPDDGPIPPEEVLAPPHTRGWTSSGVRKSPRPYGSPAHAGMDPWT